MTLPAAVRIVEVGPRDGLQNEPRAIGAAQRIGLIEQLAAAGLPAIEAGSFVSPRWVPQMANSAEVLRAVRAIDGVRFPVLVPNLRGLEDALDAGATEIALFLSASESFSRRNINCSIAESLTRADAVARSALAGGLRVRAYVSCALGCPEEGEIALAAVAAVARCLAELGCYEISLADTIGVGTPLKARRMVEAVAAVIPIERLAVHFHDTYGQALANVHACLQAGVTVVDAAAGGLGGCPYAAGASGNLATEDLVYMLDGLEIATGVDLNRLLEAVAFVADGMGIPPRSALYAARRARCAA